jgi:hypothetical protein
MAKDQRQSRSGGATRRRSSGRRKPPPAERGEQAEPEQQGADEYVIGPLPDELERLRTRLQRKR